MSSNSVFRGNKDLRGLCRFREAESGGEPPSSGVVFMELSYIVRAVASTTITLNAEAYRRLRLLKQKGESYSDVVIRRLPQHADTFGELLDFSEQDPPPQLDEATLAVALKNRKRRSKR